MLTFLFDQYQKAVLKQYRLRLYTIYLGLGSILLLIGITLTIPTYILLTTRLKATELDKTTAEKTIDTDAVTLDTEIKTLNDKISLIESNNKDLPMIIVLEKLLTKKDSDIRITSISIKRQNETGAIALGGVATTRDALVAFEKLLKSETLFSNVNLPVGSLVKSKDIPFAININAKI